MPASPVLIRCAAGTRRATLDHVFRFAVIAFSVLDSTVLTTTALTAASALASLAVLADLRI
jgi:hypothetical protein